MVTVPFLIPSFQMNETGSDNTMQGYFLKAYLFYAL